MRTKIFIYYYPVFNFLMNQRRSNYSFDDLILFCRSFVSPRQEDELFEEIMYAESENKCSNEFDGVISTSLPKDTTIVIKEETNDDSQEFESITQPVSDKESYTPSQEQEINFYKKLSVSRPSSSEISPISSDNEGNSTIL